MTKRLDETTWKHIISLMQKNCKPNPQRKGFLRGSLSNRAERYVNYNFTKPCQLIEICLREQTKLTPL